MLYDVNTLYGTMLSHLFWRLLPHFLEQLQRPANTFCAVSTLRNGQRDGVETITCGSADILEKCVGSGISTAVDVALLNERLYK